MIGAGNQVIIHWAEEGKWLRFQGPIEVFLAADPKEVVSILGHIEKEVETKKLYAAGFLAYEAGAAFDPALHFRSGGDFPLLWFGLFKEAEQFAVPAISTAPVWSPAWQSSVTREEYKTAIQAIKSFILQGATYQVNYSYRLRAPFDGAALPYFLQIAGWQNIPYAAFVESDRYAVCSFSPELFFSLRGKVISSKPMKGTMPRGIFNGDDQVIARELYLSEKNRAENVMIVDMVRNDLGRIAAKNTVAVSSLYDVEKYDTVWQMTSTVKAKTSASLFQIFKALFPPASCTGAPKVRTTRIIAKLETSPRRIYTGSIGFLAPGRRAQFNVAIRTLLVDKRCCEAEYGVGGGIVWDSVDEAEYDECAVKAKIVCAPAVDFELLETILWTPESVAKVGPEPTPAFGLPAMLCIAMQAGHPSGGGDLKEFRGKKLCSPPGRSTRSGGWDRRWKKNFASSSPDQDFFLLDLHIARLKASAAYFSFPFSENKIRTKLASLVSKFFARPALPSSRAQAEGSKAEGPQRVRLLLSRAGKISLETALYQPENTKKTCQVYQANNMAKGMLNVCLAKQPVASDDIFLYHKTTNRKVYDRAKAQCPGYDEVILWNEKGEVTEFCTGNIIVDLDGQMLTPPVSCGLLPGTYRAWLLQKGIIKEKVIKKEMLTKSRKIFLCNSVRKMQEVRIDLDALRNIEYSTSNIQP